MWEPPALGLPLVMLVLSPNGAGEPLFSIEVTPKIFKCPVAFDQTPGATILPLLERTSITVGGSGLQRVPTIRVKLE